MLPAVVLSLTIGAAAAESGPMSFGIWHVRFAAPAAKTARAAIVWDDSMRMEVEVPPRGADDSLAPPRNQVICRLANWWMAVSSSLSMASRDMRPVTYKVRYLYSGP